MKKKIAELKEYDKVCKHQKEQLKNTTQILDEILSEGTISDVNLRMHVKKITIHQNEDKSLDVNFEMNGDFSGSTSVFIETDEPKLHNLKAVSSYLLTAFLFVGADNRS